LQRSVWFLLFVVALVVLSALVIWREKVRLGLDVAGGMRFTIRAKKEALSTEELKNWEDSAREVVRILEKRSQTALGVVEASVFRKGEDRFIVELPGFTNEQEARDILQTSARMDFYWAKTVSTEYVQRTYQYTEEKDEQGNPVAVFYKRGSDKRITLKETPEEWDALIQSWDRVVEGKHLNKAIPQPWTATEYVVLMQFDAEGARALQSWGRKVLNRREWLVAVMDRNIITFARVEDGNTFERGETVLHGRFTATEAKRIADLLNAGAIPVDLVIEDVSRVNPTIGQFGLDQIKLAGLASFLIISAFLLVYYMFPGLVAFLALLCYVLFCYAAFKLLGVTFSLAAIAGFILSVGMAVDANILIFERLKEELRRGRGLLTAIDLGFRRAFPAILDSNACTIITCLVLVNIGTGPVKGFATTLGLGVLISLFTAVTVTRSLLLLFLETGIGKNPQWYGTNRGWFGERLEAGAETKPLKVVEHMGRYFLISGAFILPGVIFMALGGLKPNVEFQYGVESGILLPQGAPLSPAQLSQKLASAGFKGANAKVVEAAEGKRYVAYVTIPLEDNPTLKQMLEQQGTSIWEARQQIVRAVGGDDTLLKNERGEITGIKGEESFAQTSPTVREETILGAIKGVVLSSVLIVLYLALRFGVALGGFRTGLRFGFSAIGALIHDVLVTLGLAAIAGYFLNWEVSQLTITAILTVIGFSVHDTIVIFDRIRENLRRPLEKDNFDFLVNRSITQSFARSINTSAVVIVTLAILVFFGSTTPDLKHFNAAMLVGILSGTYSSIFNAAPILVLWDRLVGKRKGPQATLMHDLSLRARPEEEEEEEEGEPRPPAEDGRFAPTRRSKPARKKKRRR
jgi:SecD/SecF fusion protein